MLLGLFDDGRFGQAGTECQWAQDAVQACLVIIKPAIGARLVGQDFDVELVLEQEAPEQIVTLGLDDCEDAGRGIAAATVALADQEGHRADHDFLADRYRVEALDGIGVSRGRHTGSSHGLVLFGGGLGRSGDLGGICGDPVDEFIDISASGFNEGCAHGGVGVNCRIGSHYLYSLFSIWRPKTPVHF